MAVWRFDERKRDFIRVPSIVREDDECSLLGRDTLYLVAEQDRDSMFECLLYLDFGGGSTCPIWPDEDTFVVAGVKFSRSTYANPFDLDDPIESSVRTRVAALMAAARRQGGVK